MRQLESAGSAPRSVFEHAFRPSPGVTTAPTGRSGIILRSPDGRCVSLNEGASRVWTLLERGASLRTIHSLIRQEYGPPSAWLDQDLRSLLHALLHGGFLERAA